MSLEEDCRLSYYIPVAPINEDHEVFLVQHANNNRFFVKKALHYYNLELFRCLKDDPVCNMPHIYDIMELDGCLHMIEEYISGPTLEDIITTDGPLSEDRTISYTHQLCGILKDLHNRKPPIIHRDIKPSNIIITPDDTLKLLDLSAAKLSDTSKNQDTIMMGTAGYAAPEQYGFTSSSTLTDIYAVGVLMNRMLTGEMLNVKRYNWRLSAVIDTCTQLDPSKRYNCIEKLDAALYAFEPPKAVINRFNDVSYRKYLPPGFRSGKIFPMLLSLAGYILLFSITFSLSADNNPSLRATIVNRIGATLAFLSVIFFSGNYLNCQNLLPLSKSENRIVKILGVILWDIVLFVIVALVVAALEG